MLEPRGNALEIITVSEDPSIPLRETVFLALRKAILTGRLEPGERLTEIRLGKMLGTSRTPIREAIRKLELEGLVTIIPGSGARVAQITESEIIDVLEVRSSLDELCARLASRRITPEQKERLRAANKGFKEAVLKGDQLAITEADVDIHDAITEAADNHTLSKTLERLADNIYRYRFAYIRDVRLYEQLVMEHDALCRAILEGNEEEAAAMARVHIENQRDSILEQLRIMQRRSY